MPNKHFKTKMRRFGCKMEVWHLLQVRKCENRISLGTPPPLIIGLVAILSTEISQALSM